MKKILAFLLAFVMLIPQFTVSFAADDIQTGDFTAVNLSSIKFINYTGLTATSEYRQTGSFTALLSDVNLKRNIELPVISGDFTKGKYLEFYLYSPAKYDTRFALALYSDNKDTVCKDYYYTMVNTNFEGWKLISLELSDFKAVHSPNGMDKIDYVCIMPNYGGHIPEEGTKLYFDTMFVRLAKSPGAGAVTGGTVQKAFTLLDPQNGAVGTATPVALNGVSCLKWACIDGAMKPIKISTKDKVDVSQYGELKLAVYSEKATNNTANIVFYADNPTTDALDYYRTSFTIDWEGEWRDISFVLSEGANGSFSTGHSPAGWDKIETFDLGIAGFTNETLDPETVLYLDKITLDGVPKEEGDDIGILENQYDPSTMTDYSALIKQTNPDMGHPRLILTDEKIAQIKKYKDSDSYLNTSLAEVLTEADAYLKTPLTSSKTNGKRLDWTPSTLIPTCALAYVITEDVRYKDRAWEEIENICSFQSWNPTHFLDVGEYSRAVALAYDWLYSDWTAEQRKIMRDGVMKNAFTPAVKQLRNGNGSWLSQRSNWIEVGASGIGLCALAFADEEEYEPLCNEILYRTLEVHLPQKGLFMFAPDGAYSEGIGYWNYALYTFYLLTGSMHTALGTDMGLEDYEGLSKTGYFPLAVIGPNGMFAFSDSDVDILPGGAPVYHYVGMRYNVPSLTAYRVNNCDVADYRDILWYDPEYPKMADYSEGLALDYFASGYEPLGSFRTGYSKNSYYFGFKGGNNNGNHDQYDIGSFVIDANGVRWAEEIGPEAYSVTGERFTYYRNRAEGNNTLVINPDGRLHDQTSKDEDTISDYIDKGSADGAAYGIFDITKAYKTDLTKAHRGFALVNNRTQFIVRDEIDALQKSEIYSFFHVKKDMQIDIAADGKSLMLTASNGKKCAVNLVSSISGAKFGQMDAVHLESSPKPEANDGTNNNDFKKFYVHADDVTKGDITVVYTPILEDEAVELPDIKAFSDWSEYVTSSISITSLSIDEIPHLSFAPGVANYIVPSEKVGIVSATAEDDAKISITQASTVGDTAIIKVQSADGLDEGTYRVKFEKPLDPPVKSGAAIASAKASDVPQAANVPENTYDGDINTRWSAEGEQWIEWDLGSAKTINGISLSFMSGDTRRNVFKIEASEDGTSYTTVYEGKSSGKTLELERYDFDITWARFVRYTGFGNENYEGEMINPWNSVSELVIHEIFTDFEDTIGHWASDDINYMRRYELVNGVSDTLFEPESSVTAAQLITMVCRALELNNAEYQNSFSDVSADSWYAPYIASAVENNLIPAEMTKDARLNPDQPLTRDKMSAIVVKAYESISGSSTPAYNLVDRFTDVSDSEYSEYIDKAITLRLVNGTADSSFEPLSVLTRAQAATIVKRLFVKLYNDFN